MTKNSQVFTEQTCVDCRFAKSDVNLSRRKKVCTLAYGYRYDDDKKCRLFEPGCYEDFIVPVRGATI